MKVPGANWNKADVIALVGVIIGLVAAIAAVMSVPGIPKLFHLDYEKSAQHADTSPAITTRVDNDKRTSSVEHEVKPAAEPSRVSSQPSNASKILGEYLSVAGHTEGYGRAWPVLMYDESGNQYSILREGAQSALRQVGNSTPPIFRNPLPPDHYSKLFNADAALMSKFQPFCEGLIMGMVRESTSRSQQFEGMYTTHMSADVKRVSTSGRTLQEFNIAENGSGFSEETSKTSAEERLSRKLKSELATALSK